MSENSDVRRIRTERTRRDSVGGEDHVMGGHVEGILFGLGNPLLDIMAVVTEEFLQKYHLNKEDCILCNESHLALFKEMVAQFNVEYVPGGAALNSIRIAQWLIGVPNATTYMGCISKDEFGTVLESKVKAEGVRAVFQYDHTEPTGTCAVCLTGQNRSLVAYLGAAKHLKVNHLKIPENRRFMESAHYFYMSSFPLTVSPASVLDVAKFASDNDRMLAFNLSAPFLCRDYHNAMMSVMPYVDILFGNEDEAKVFAEAEHWEAKDLREIALMLARLPKASGKRGRMVICTQGANPTLVIKEGVVAEYPVIPIKKEDIVDTNGAGDAFVGGFLSQLVQGGSIVDCIRAANYAANYIIQQSGCQIPDKPNFSPESVGF